MKKFTTLMTVCSLVLAGAVMAQQPTPEESQPPGKNPKSERKAPEVKPKGTIAPKTEAPPVKEPAVKESAPPNMDKAEKKGPPNRKSVTPETKTPATSTDQPAATATPADKKEKSNPNRKDKKAPGPTTDASSTPATAKTTATPKSKATSSPAAATASSTPATTASTTPATTASTTPATTASTTPATTASTTPAATGTPATTASASAAPSNSVNPTAATKKLDTQKVQQIKQQHASFRAQPRPDRVPAVTFSANFRLPGSDRWQGPQYEVYRSYHPERHDRGWYHQHHQRVELISGGYYYFDNGYWYPAWGYDTGHEYYAYDAPIYVGKTAEPADKVIANVQAALQDMGYYKGEVDGLIGPLTREALTAYQTDNGMAVTAVIDEPTLDSLNLG